jgi:hypothetical protein
MNTVKLAVLFSVTIIFFVSCAQKEKAQAPIVISPTEIPKQIIEPANPYAEVDKSPVDISYYPVNYPKQLMEGNDSATLTARVIYSRPHKANRQIFSEDGPPKSILQYGDYWRLGANEATEIELFKPVTVNGQKVLKGRYIIYCIPHADKWTIVLNSNLFSFGLHQDDAKDVVKVEIPVLLTTDNVEDFTMVFQKANGGANLVMAWGNVKASLPLSF